MLRNRSTIFKNDNKVAWLLVVEEDLLDYVKQLPNTKDIESKLILKIVTDFYFAKDSLTETRKELLNFILNNQLDWSEILKSLETVKG